eukprot:COSAG05_NODE_7598_length_791_cov_1.589595_1_plen_131_part_00
MAKQVGFLLWAKLIHLAYMWQTANETYAPCRQHPSQAPQYVLLAQLRFRPLIFEALREPDNVYKVHSEKLMSRSAGAAKHNGSICLRFEADGGRAIIEITENDAHHLEYADTLQKKRRPRGQQYRQGLRV